MNLKCLVRVNFRVYDSGERSQQCWGRQQQRAPGLRLQRGGNGTVEGRTTQPRMSARGWHIEQHPGGVCPVAAPGRGWPWVILG